MRRVLDVKQNDQIDNKQLGRIKASWQCGYTAAAMLLSSLFEEANTDEFIAELVILMDDEYIKNKSNTRNGAFLARYPDHINSILKKRSINKKVVFMPHSGGNNHIIQAINNGSPVMCSTMITNEGHYVLIIGYDEDRKVWIVNDPYGHYSFAESKYKIIGKNSGAGVEYPYTLLGNAMIKSSKLAANKTGYRLLWLE
jgi:uncharacterized protein YvpB